MTMTYRRYGPNNLIQIPGKDIQRVEIERLDPSEIYSRWPNVVHEGRGRRQKEFVPIITDGNPGRWVTLFGWRFVVLAERREKYWVDVHYVESPTIDQRCVWDLMEAYYSASAPPLEIAHYAFEARDVLDATWQELARRTMITPGALHHYKSLLVDLAPELRVEVESGNLTFKEARSIADIEDQKLQCKIADPFISGERSSVEIERVVKLAKRHSDWDVSQIFDTIDGKIVVEEVTEADVEPEPPPPNEYDAQPLESRLLHLAGELDKLTMETIPEYKRLKLVSSMRILQARLTAAQASLA